MISHGWGRYPLFHPKKTVKPATARAARHGLSVLPQPCLPRGMGRSYGDSALGSHLISSERLNCFLDFDPLTGRLRCQSGVMLADILHVFVPQGFFLPVTPGTRWVTIGGAIASDVHGKNHHVHGCFSEWVHDIEILLGNGEIVNCSREKHPMLFRATAGGMGLTGMILSATIQLTPIPSAFIQQKTVKTRDLQETWAVFEAHQEATYSVAWIDCLAKGSHLGRSHVMLGEYDPGASRVRLKEPRWQMPFDAPSGCLNAWSIRAFNACYYHRRRERVTEQQLPLTAFFYPLDHIGDWNRLYGRAGFLQYQFVIPRDSSEQAWPTLLKMISDEQAGSFLAVLKGFGPQNDCFLSFPLAGYTLALDFKVTPGIFAFLDRLDERVLAAGGRVYLTKDARLSESTFKKSYPDWEQFQAVRDEYHAMGVFSSLQSERLGLS